MGQHARCTVTALDEARLPNQGLLQTGAILAVALTRLESSLVTSLTHVVASRELARCRIPSR
jgi:hypothetical protein